MWYIWRTEREVGYCSTYDEIPDDGVIEVETEWYSRWALEKAQEWAKTYHLTLKA